MKTLLNLRFRLTRHNTWIASTLGLLALTCCSCKNVPQQLPTVGSPAPQAVESAQPSLAPLTHVRDVQPADGPAPAAAAVYTVPAAGGPAAIRPLSHNALRAPEPSSQPAAHQQPLAPIVPMDAARPAPVSSAPVSSAGGNAAFQAQFGQSAPAPGVVVENGQAFMDNPPAGLEYEWVPAGSCGCAPDADRCGTRPYISPDEFICDGGDIKAKIQVMKNFDVRNIDMTDTVGHFDTLDGRRLVEESNRVCIYAPRFAAVRRVDRSFENEALNTAALYDRDVRLNSQEHHALVGSMLQPVVPNKRLSTLAANAVLEQDGGQNIDKIYAPLGAANPVPPFENFEIIQRGVFLNSEKPRLYEHVEAALVWMTYDSVEVMISERRAQAVEQKARPQETVLYELDGKPRLRICKVASTDHAQPGDTVDFTIRFDNIGDQKVGNVTILDSLTTRLEYVPDSESCSVDADFFTVENEGASVVLRWEIKDPLKVGEGGVVRFKCKVR